MKPDKFEEYLRKRVKDLELKYSTDLDILTRTYVNQRRKEVKRILAAYRRMRGKRK